jgi:hypothetical protein
MKKWSEEKEHKIKKSKSNLTKQKSMPDEKSRQKKPEFPQSV